MGLDGAVRFLRQAGTNPDALAASAFPREARANRSIFYTRSGEARSMGEVYALMARKIGSGDAGAAQMARKPATDNAQLAFADQVLAEPGEKQTDAARMLATLGHGNRPDMLRPSPAQARLAYLMLSTTVV